MIMEIFNLITSLRSITFTDLVESLPTAVPDNNRKSRSSPTSVPEMSPGKPQFPTMIGISTCNPLRHPNETFSLNLIFVMTFDPRGEPLMIWGLWQRISLVNRLIFLAGRAVNFFPRFCPSLPLGRHFEAINHFITR